MTALDHLLSPHSSSEFFADIWEQRPLLVNRGTPTYYHDILRDRDVEQLLADRFEAKPEALEMFHPDPKAHVRRRPGAVEHITNAYKLGATIRCYGAEESWPSIRRLCQQLEWQFGAAIGANLYCTPPNVQGLKRHFDGHDTLILQIAGSKYWQVLPPIKELPLEFMPALPFETRAQTSERINARDVENGRLATTVTAPKTEYALEAGDLLYVPRGYVHEPGTREELSIHLTIGIYALTWRDALTVALTNLAENDPRLRRAIRIGFLGEALSFEDRHAAKTLVSELAQRIDVPKALEDLARQFATTRAIPSMNLSPSLTAGMTGDSIIRPASGFPFRILEDESRVGLCWGPRTLWAPMPVTDAFRRLSKANIIKVRDIGCGLSEQAMLTLAKRLVAEGGFALEVQT